MINTLALFFVRFGAVALQAVAFLYSSRLVDLDMYGQFAYAWGLGLIGAAVAGLGGAQTLLRALPHLCDVGDYRNALSCVRVSMLRPIILLASLVIFVFLVPAGPLRELTTLSKPSLITTLFTSLVVSELLIVGSIARQAVGPNAVIVFRDLLPWLIFILLLVLASSRIDTHYGMLLGCLLISHLVSLFVGLLFSRRFLLDLYLSSRSQAPVDAASDIVEYRWFAVSSVVASMTANLDVVVGRLLLGAETVGAFSLIKRASSFIGICQNVANMLISRKLIELRNSAESEELQALVSWSFYVAFVPACVLSVFLYFTRSLWFGYLSIPETDLLGSVLVVVIAAASFNVMCGANILVAAQFGEEKFVFVARIVSLVFLVITIVSLTANLDVLALALSFLVQVVLINLLVTFFIKRKYELWTSVPLPLFVK